MKTIIKSLGAIVMFQCIVVSQLSAQTKFDFGKDQCVHCNMIVRDQLHSAIVIDKKDQILKFDAIECMVNYIKAKNEKDFKQLLVADYSDKGKLTNATEATFLKSKAIPSPMGAFLSAFSNETEAVNIKNDKGGELFSWKELLQKFREMGFDTQIHQHFRPDAYAPIGVMGDHLHHKGGLMFSFRYMTMNMGGIKEGSHLIESATVLSNYMASPESMNMQMVMLGIMYAPSDKLTLMLMPTFVSKKMNMVNRMGGFFTTQALGIGDLKVSGLYSLIDNPKFSIHSNLGMSIPLGKTDLTDDTPTRNNMKLPYSMQTGTGTYNFLLGLTVKGHGESISWGIQQLNNIRSGENQEGYRFGNMYQLNSWGAVKFFDWMSLSLRILGIYSKELVGIDTDLNPMMAPAADATNYGGTRINTYIGTNISFSQHSAFKRLKMGIEAGIPVYENFNGIQMYQENTFQIGLRYTSL